MNERTMHPFVEKKKHKYILRSNKVQNNGDKREKNQNFAQRNNFDA